MRVAQINSVCGIGSTGRIAVDLSKAMTSCGIENSIYYGIGNSDFPNSVKIGSRLNVRLHQLGTRLLGKHGFYSHKATKQLIKLLKSENPDIIHLHNIHGHYLNIKLLFEYLQKSDAKVIWTLHDCWAFTGHCAYFDIAGCGKWKTGCGNCPQKKAYPGSYIFDRSKKLFVKKSELFTSVNNVTIVTPSKWLKNLAGQSYLKKHDIRVINNGIDLSVFKPSGNALAKKLGIADKIIVLGICSSLYDRKGGKHLKEAAEILGDSYRIVFLGLNTDEALPDNVTVLETEHNPSKIAEIYSMADIFANPTYEDNFPTVNIESLACGTPVITFDTGGSPESLDENTGIVLREKSSAALAEAIKKLGKKTPQIINDCKTRAEKNYGADDKYAEYIRLYKAVLNE